jgi:cytochrome c-type biogenesis protein
MDSISPWVAFVAGVLCLFTPCVLPMLPVYLASISSPDILKTGAGEHRLSILLHSLSFVLGFSLVFILLGTLAGLIGFRLNPHSEAVRWISGCVMIGFGLFLLAAPKISWLNYEKRISLKHTVSNSYLRAFIIGVVFTLAWTPCVGPVLGGILTLAVNSGSVWQGSYLLVFYSIGMALPFLIIGLAFDFIMPVIKRIGRYSNYIYLVSGVLLIGVGILILLDKLSWFSF